MSNGDVSLAEGFREACRMLGEATVMASFTGQEMHRLTAENAELRIALAEQQAPPTP